MPAAEVALIESVVAGGRQFTAAGNGHDRVAARARRVMAIRKALGGGRAFRGWIGKIGELSSTPAGDAFVRIDLPDTSIGIGTWEDSAADARDHTLIARSSRLCRRLADIGIGATVAFHGRFVPSAADFIAESSLDEGGTMTSPTFVAHIDDVRPYP